VLSAFVDELFPGMEVKGAYQFRVTRNSELIVDEEEVENLALALRDELLGRGYLRAMRLEIAEQCPKPIVRTLLENFDLPENAVYRINGPVNLNRVIQVYDMVQRPDLKFAPFQPRALADSEAMFERVAEGDVLLHHPFDSFAPVLELIKQAAEDPNVLAIKQTLYRAGKDSPIVEQLVQAARNGKDVIVVVELRARFDEEANLGLADRLQDAGVQVVYGVVGYKTHAKMLLIVRREGRKLRRYTHLGTGNYHSGTARVYTDFGLITADADIGNDVDLIFRQMSGMAPATKLKRLLQSPFTLHPGVLQRIDRETKHARAGKPAHIIAKMNALNEPQVVRALYTASQAGVKVDLIVRGACTLRPGVPGVSDNIRVRSIVGRFLEHHRVYWFGNDGDPDLFCSSADWLERNLLRRVETCFPVLDPELAARVYDEALANYLADNLNAWELLPTGEYGKVVPGEAMPHSAQLSLLAKLCN
jgi:polyphosphate kinase